MKTRNILSLLTALALALTAPAAVAEGLTLTDMAGREITLEAPATRVIALNPADCEILYALGAEDVGTSNHFQSLSLLFSQVNCVPLLTG